MSGGAPKFVVITGGVLSGLGKGLVAAGLGMLLRSRGLRVTPIKFDGYLNVDAGTMNPYEHGEVYVLDDGTECDMDLGTYERFMDVTLEGDNNITSGKLLLSVISKERRGEYLGKTVQFIPHVTGEAKRWILRVAEEQGADVVIMEVGGTVGDIENAYFIEAIRQLSNELGRENFAFVHVTLVPELPSGEQKTKPTQHSVSVLRSMGIDPDVIVARSRRPLEPKARQKIALYCGVREENVISDPDVGSIYRVPLLLEEHGLAERVAEVLGMSSAKAQAPGHGEGDLAELRRLLDRWESSRESVAVAIVGKYTHLRDAYASLLAAIDHASMHLSLRVDVRWIEATDVERGLIDVRSELEGVQGIVVPGGFGRRGAEGKVESIRVAREEGIPFLGLCFGLQLAVVEYARSVCGLEGANSTEVDPETPHPVIDLLPEQRGVGGKGGTMRLGAHPAVLRPGTLVHRIYGADLVFERHRHRYEVNPMYHNLLRGCGLVFSGTSPDGKLVEFIELPDHPFFVATQAHPEFKSRVLRPHPLFTAFLRACSGEEI